MSKKVLIVEENDSYRQEILKLLESRNFQLIEATNGKDALNVISNQKLDLILANTKVPPMGITNLITEIRALGETSAEIPIILITSLSDVAEVSDAFGLGVSEFLIRPLDPNQFMTSIQIALGLFIDRAASVPSSSKSSTAENDSSNLENEYYPIAIERFINGHKIKYPIFVKLKENKFVNIGHEGEDFSKNRVEHLKQKNIFYLYLKNSDYKKYLGIIADPIPDPEGEED